MMIRSARIPSVLNRICDDEIIMSLMITADGELLGVSNKQQTDPQSVQQYNKLPDPESLGTLVADIAMDYHRLGEEFAMLTTSIPDSYTHHRSGGGGNSTRTSHMQCLLLEMEYGTIGISACSSSTDCLVIAIAKHTAPPGLIKTRLNVLAQYVQESLSSFAQSSSAPTTTSSTQSSASTNSGTNTNIQVGTT